MSNGSFATTVVWVHCVADYLLAGVYLALAGALVYLVSRARSAVPAPALYIAAAVFSVACGTTHLIAPVTRWSPASSTAAIVKVVCAVASLATIVLFIWMLPAIVAKLLDAQRARTLLEGELAGATGELGDLAEELATSCRRADAACAEAERSNRLKSDFLRLVAHELRSPVTVLKLNTEQLTAPPMDVDGRARIERVTAASERLLRLSETLLTYAELQTGVSSLHLQEVDVALLARRVVASFDGRARIKQAELSVIVRCDVARVIADEQMLRLVLEHLVDNAVQYGGRRSSVTVIGGRHEHCVAVHDTGPGLPADVRTRLFEPFVTGESIVRKHAPGLGMGLALVRLAITEMGGRIELKQTTEEGMTFAIFLRRADEARS